MKTSTIFRTQWMFLVAVVLLLPLLAGCQEEGLPDEEGAEVSLIRVQDIPGYASLPLVGSQWKLIGFVDGKRNRIRLAKPKGGESFTITFQETGEIRGHTSTNAAFGKYSIGEDFELWISDFHNTTEIGEVFDGIYFIELMNKIYSYRISSKGLALYYDKDLYLLFLPMEKSISVG